MKEERLTKWMQTNRQDKLVNKIQRIKKLIDSPSFDPFAPNIYVWNIEDCKNNCWKYNKCELVDKYYELFEKLKDKEQSRLTDISQEKEIFQRLLEEFRETARKMEKCYRLGWKIKQKGYNNRIKSLKYKQ